jgi:hypothetical protein
VHFFDFEQAGRIGMAEAGPDAGAEEEGGQRMEEGEKFLYKPQNVKLVSAEGFEFVVDRKAAIISNMLRNMLSASGKFVLPSRFIIITFFYHLLP